MFLVCKALHAICVLPACLAALVVTVRRGLPQEKLESFKTVVWRPVGLMVGCRASMRDDSTPVKLTAGAQAWPSCCTRCCLERPVTGNYHTDDRLRHVASFEAIGDVACIFDGSRSTRSMQHCATVPYTVSRISVLCSLTRTCLATERTANTVVHSRAGGCVAFAGLRRQCMRDCATGRC